MRCLKKRGGKRWLSWVTDGRFVGHSVVQRSWAAEKSVLGLSSLFSALCESWERLQGPPVVYPLLNSNSNQRRSADTKSSQMIAFFYRFCRNLWHNLYLNTNPSMHFWWFFNLTHQTKDRILFLKQVGTCEKLILFIWTSRFQCEKHDVHMNTINFWRVKLWLFAERL